MPSQRGKWLGQQFSWTDHIRVLLPTGRPLKPLEHACLQAARHADWCLRNDKSGFSGPAWLSRLFRLMRRSRLAAHYKAKRTYMLEDRRAHPLDYDPLRIPTRFNHELCTLADPEHFVLTPDNDS